MQTQTDLVHDSGSSVVSLGEVRQTLSSLRSSLSECYAELGECRKHQQDHEQDFKVCSELTEQLDKTSSKLSHVLQVWEVYLSCKEHWSFFHFEGDGSYWFYGFPFVRVVNGELSSVADFGKYWVRTQGNEFFVENFVENSVSPSGGLRLVFDKFPLRSFQVGAEKGGYLGFWSKEKDPCNLAITRDDLACLAGVDGWSPASY